MTDQDNNKVNVGVWETVRILIVLVLCAGIAYKQGVAKGESSALRGSIRSGLDRVRCVEGSMRRDVN